MAQSLAEKYRRHRQVMELARELGVLASALVV